MSAPRRWVGPGLAVALVLLLGWLLWEGCATVREVAALIFT
jgi:hypothetical protein